MSSLNLYRATVTQEWSATADALVWASDEVSAKLLASRRVEIDIFNASKCNYVSVKPESMDAGLIDRIDDDKLWLIMPDGEVCGNDRDGIAKFQGLLEPDQLEAMRLARIEAGNGQMTLWEMQP